MHTSEQLWLSWGWFSIKIPSYQYRNFHCGDQRILGPTHLHNGISYTGKIASLYWIRSQFTKWFREVLCFTVSFYIENNPINRSYKDHNKLWLHLLDSLKLSKNKKGNTMCVFKWRRECDAGSIERNGICSKDTGDLKYGGSYTGDKHRWKVRDFTRDWFKEWPKNNETNELSLDVHSRSITSHFLGI